MKYMITVRMPFEAVDDLKAREVASGYAGSLQAWFRALKEAGGGRHIEGQTVKLQELPDNRPPRGIEI